MKTGFSPRLICALALVGLLSGCESASDLGSILQGPTTTPPDSGTPSAPPVTTTPTTPVETTPTPTRTPTPAPTSAPTSTPVPTATPTSTPTTTPTVTPTSTPSPTPSASATPSAQPIALVYGGPGVLTGPDDTLVRAKFVAAAAGFKVIVVTERVDPAVLDSASVWIQPGGPNLSADAHMNANGMTGQVRDFVKRGGGYVGFCGGAFSAVNNLGLITGSAYNLDQTTEKIPVKWSGKTRYVHFEHGPYINLSDKNAEVIGTYANGSVAVVRSHFGKGAVYISGVHPEANSDWPPTYDPDGSDVDLAEGMIREVAARPSPL